MIISLIVAVDEQFGIGKDNQLPWHLPSDLKRFKQLTLGHYIIMGRKTYETIGRSLPGRTMVILTRQKGYKVGDCLVVHSLDEAIRKAQHANESEVFIIGGGQIFEQAIKLANRIYLTIVHTDAHADIFFPQLDPAEWVTISDKKTILGGEDELPSDFLVFNRK